jgi:hypothetical protein
MPLPMGSLPWLQKPRRTPTPALEEASLRPRTAEGEPPDCVSVNATRWGLDPTPEVIDVGLGLARRPPDGAHRQGPQAQQPEHRELFRMGEL